MKIEGKFILKVAGTLTAISLVVAALLGATNALTEDKIAAINKANTEVALAAVVSSPDCEFPPIEEIPQAAIDAAKTQSGKLTEAYRVVVNGEDAGYAFKIVAGGSQGDIEMIVGVDADLAITGISVVDAAETSGIGTKVIANEATTAGTGALDQFVGKSGAGSLVVKTNIDAVSGATLTSNAVFTAMDSCLAQAGTGSAGAEDLTDGTYTSSAKGCLSDVEVTVTVSGGKVSEVAIDASGETPELGGAAAETLADALTKAGSTNGVDAVSGATMTSEAVFTAMNDCLSQAQ